jgi:hypothetical protein
MGWLFKQNQRANKRLPNPQRMMTLVIMKMMSLMMSKWLSSSRILEGFKRRATSEAMARTRTSMNQEEDQISLVLVARKLGISLRIVQKIKRRTRTPRRAHLIKKSQGTRSTPVKLTLAKNEIQMKRATPTMKMLQPWHSRHLHLILQAYLKILPMKKIKAQSCASWQRT